MKIAIVGSRGFPSAYQQIYQWFRSRYARELPIGNTQLDTIVSGGARGPDSYAERLAELWGIRTEIYPADWEQYGSRAGIIRNRQIVEAADKVVAFWDGESKGTKNTITLALQLKKNLQVIFP